MELMSEGQWEGGGGGARLGGGKLAGGGGARGLGVAGRQVRRIRRRVGEGGRAGLQHGNRGQVPVNKLRAAVRARILRLRRGKYRDFNDVHFTEKLAAETPPVLIGVRTVRRLLRAAGVGAVRGRRPPKHRRRRDRKAQAGLMLLWDGSRHDWLEGRGPWLCLVAAIDDATGALLAGAHFVEQECAAGYLRVLRDVVATHGVPWSIYMDQHGALKRNDDHWTLAEELRGAQDPTQVGQALQALGIEAIYALSPQAKGRVERLWGARQDRLVSELPLAGAATAAAADAGLAPYPPGRDRPLAILPPDTTPAWRPPRPGGRLDPAGSFPHEA